MSYKVLSTYKVLMMKSQKLDFDESWVFWAIEMLEAGYRWENLSRLAGLSEPYDQIENQRLTDKVISELHLVIWDRDILTDKFIYYLFKTNVNNPENYKIVLSELMRLRLSLWMNKKYMTFIYCFGRLMI